MNSSTISTVMSIVIALIILIGGEYIFINYSGVLEKFLANVTIIYTLSLALITVMWHGITRLNSLDNLEGLKGEHTRLVQHRIDALKRTLYYRVAWLFLTAFTLFVCSSIRSLSLLVDIALSVVIPFALSIIWMNSIGYVRFYISIDEFRRKVNEMCQKEKARRKLIDEMKKDRQAHPIQPDLHLESYRKVFDDQHAKTHPLDN